MLTKSNVIFLILLVFCTSCIERYSKHGYMPDEEHLSKIKPGSTAKELLIPLIGAPAFTTGDNNNESWYYAKSKKKYVSFLKAEIVENDIIKLNINNGIVNKIEYFDISDMQNITFSEDSTSKTKAKLGIWQQLIGNVGRFSNNAEF